MTARDHPKRYCIVGAGASGLAVVKTFAERGIPFDCFEREADIGGVWNADHPHAVYERTFLNSSRKLSRYTDFKIDENLPIYLSRAQAQDYLSAYADHFGLRDRIRFSAEVVRAEADPDGWTITIRGEAAPRRYGGLVIANGHHWAKKSPVYEGTFAGEMVHSHDLKRRDQLQDKRVLVVGAGNSGADIVCDAAHVGRAAIHSMRRSYYFFPKTVFGKPTDVFIDLLSRWPVPRGIMRRLYQLGLRLLIGPHSAYGLPEPDHKLFEAHPTSASNYLDHLAHGRITPKPGIARLDGNHVHFTDGSAEEVDLIVNATGYRPSFPFLDGSLILDAEGRSRLFLHLMHRNRDDLFVVGLVEPAEGGMWQLADWQSKLVASYIVGCALDATAAADLRALKVDAVPDVGHGIRFSGTDWHKFEIQHYRYRMFIRRLLKKLGDCAEAQYPHADSASANIPDQLKLAS